MSHTLEKSSFTFEGMQVGYYHGGKGKPLMMIHGSGPGASSLGNWSRVLEPLSQHYRVYAMDLIGFGISDRNRQQPAFDFEMWVRQARAMLDLIDAPQIGVIGHSLSAAIALKLASADPRISAVLTTGAIGAPFTINEATQRVWRCPTDRQQLIATLSTLIHDASIIDDSYIRAREPVVFAAGYADYFNGMFSGDQQQYVQKTTLSDDTLSAINCPVLMLHGRNDIPFPAKTSEILAAKIKYADLQILCECSHSVAFERSAAFIAAANQIFI
ncbi:alpha/beta hydrolase [Erwinia sp. OLTSP20]|uniref:alpha/beta fold hydrolase n=1 Tax=unclassified Erwinia TaxID=2622719 RepID=UPI000C174C5D|nr:MULTISPECIES: alpha/beta hydrolase [unclassified Erwinia]PIJ50141.1 alpha/beta hydrolase [Erwinia sp. OAMSP11]PIJ71907.1 alpha/beta hydrolase [Erwinia sp. OLSSP12]PIJ81109.1 alpha/beta hydrolase [Erwinia sp. OLCASP19]PIJ83539.1 alpha/beta hydrolase [Erwinia sp. OLMTSP26]PIJ86154.1 alpha/beta hydrolase [Erwinia sp. OLMDSP33]